MSGNAENIANEVTKVLSAKRQRNILIIVILLLVGAGVFAYNKYSNLKVDLAISQQNEKALSDSVRVSKNKVGELTYSKNILVSENGNLKDLNSDLNDELNKTKGKVRELNKIIAEFKPDTIYIENELIKYADGSFGLLWDYDTTYSLNNFRSLSGISKFDLDANGVITPLETMISKDIIGFTLTTGLREKDGNIEIFATTPYPNLEILALDGAIIDPKSHPALKKFTKKKRFGIGPYVGVGLGVNTWPRVDFGFGFHVGIGIHYDLFQF